MTFNLVINIAYLSFFLWFAGVMTSISFAALSQILIIPVLIYFYRHVFNLKKWSGSQWSLFLMSLAIVLSVFFGDQTPLKNMAKIKYFIFPILMIPIFQILYTRYMSHTKKKILLHVFLWGTTIATIAGVIALYTGFNPIKMKGACHPERNCGLFGMYMTYGYGIGLFTTLSLGLWLFADKFKQYISKNALLIILIINLMGSFLSYARGAWIGFIVSLLPLLYFRFKNKFIPFFIGIILILAGLSFVPKVRETFTSDSRTTSTYIRYSMFKAAYMAYKENPIFGIGYRNFEPKSIEIKKKYNIEYPDFMGQAHNNYLEQLATTGIIGLTTFLMFLFFWMRELLQRNDIVGKIGLAFMANFLVSGMTECTFSDGENVFLIMGFYLVTQIKPEKVKALFLDRDGVLIYDSAYPHKAEDLKINQAIIPVLKHAQSKLIPLFVLTNQAGIAKGMFSIQQYLNFNKLMIQEFRKFGIYFTQVSFCPYHPEGTVSPYNTDSVLRKPNRGMLDQIEQDFWIDEESSFMIGDKPSDILKDSKLKTYIYQGQYSLEGVPHDKIITNFNVLIEKLG